MLIEGERMKKITLKEVRLSLTSIFLAVLATVLLYMVAQSRGMDFAEIAGDAVTVLNGRTLTGVYSNLGITMLGVSSVLYFASWYNLKLHNPDFIGTKLALGFGIISMMLYLDDFFMIHEKIMRDFFGIPEEFMMGLYFVSVLILIFLYYKRIRTYGLVYILLSFGFLGLSAVADVAYKYIKFPFNEVIEDGSKFIGICLWLTFSMCLTRFFFHDEMVEACMNR